MPASITVRGTARSKSKISLSLLALRQSHGIESNPLKTCKGRHEGVFGDSCTCFAFKKEDFGYRVPRLGRFVMPCTVQLIAYTPDPVRVVAAAAKLCYSPSSAASLFDGLDTGTVGKFLNQLLLSGHMSPFEHASFTFSIDGLSRVASHQLVRHRIASFSQQSQRYVSSESVDIVLPTSISENSDARDVFLKCAEDSFNAYQLLVSMGVPREDARFILPHGWSTSLVMTMNARELHHFFALRLCRRAQWEIRALAARMLSLVCGVAGELFHHSGPSCISEGRCGELKPCGQPYTGIEELLQEGACSPDGISTEIKATSSNTEEYQLGCDG